MIIKLLNIIFRYTSYLKKDIDVDVEDIYKIIRERVVINNGAIDYTTKGNIPDLDANLKFSGYFHFDQNNSITF